MNLHKLLLAHNACYKAGRTMIPFGIMVHSTGADNPNLNRYVGPDDGLLGKNKYGNHWNQDKPDGRKVCVQAFIGKLADGSIATYQTLPWTYRGWHCGGSGNDNYIGFEICEDGLTDAGYFGKVYQEAVELCAYLCKQYGIRPERPYLICHSEGHELGIASNHGDVMHWFPRHGKSMDTFRADVKAKLDAGTAPAKEPAKTAFEPYLVKVMASVLNIRKGPGTSYAITGQIKDKGTYTIVAKSGSWGKLKSGAGWISLSYTSKAGKASAVKKALKVGSRVKVKKGAKTYTGGGLARFVYTTVYDVIQAKGDRVVIGKGKAVTAAIKASDLIVQ